MATYGVTAAGFVPKPLDAIKTDLEASIKTAFGAGVNVLPRSNFGQIIGIMADRFSELWQGLEAVHASEYPDSASAIDLDNVAGISGTLRHLAASSTVLGVVLVGTAGTVVPAGSVASVTGVGTRFDSIADATILALVAWAQSTAYALGALKTCNGNVYRCAQAGTSSNSGTGPSGTGAAIADGTCEWEYIAPGTAAVAVDFIAEETGPFPAYARTLTTIATPVSGWAAVSNPLDGIVGQDQESDPNLRVRREKELRGQGLGAVDAVRARLLRVTGVTAASVYENVTDATDGNGLPPHSIMCVIQGGADQDIIDAIWAAKPAGIATYGTNTGSAQDSQGALHTVNFSRLTAVNVWVTVNITKQPTGWPADGVAQVQDALVAWAAANLVGGVSVKTSKLYPPIETVSGIDDVTAIYIGTAPSPGSSANIAITPLQIASFDTSRIVVTVV